MMFVIWCNILHHFELNFQVLVLKINWLLCIVQLLLWQNKISSSCQCICSHAINKGILIDWSTSVWTDSYILCLSDEIIIMQRLGVGACNFLKCSSNTLIPINYVMWSNILFSSLPTILEAYAEEYKFKQQAKTHGCDENDYIAKSALQYTVQQVAYSIAHRWKPVKPALCHFRPAAF